MAPPQARIGAVPHSLARLGKLWVAALVAAVAGLGMKRLSPSGHPVITGVFVLVPYGVVYLTLTQLMGVSMLQTALRRLRGH